MTTTTKHPASSNRVAVAALAVAAALVGAALTWTVVPSVSAAVGMGVLGALGVVVLAEAAAVVWSWRHNREERAALNRRSQAASIALAAAPVSPSQAETWFPPLDQVENAGRYWMENEWMEHEWRGLDFGEPDIYVVPIPELSSVNPSSAAASDRDVGLFPSEWESRGF